MAEAKQRPPGRPRKIEALAADKRQPKISFAKASDSAKAKQSTEMSVSGNGNHITISGPPVSIRCIMFLKNAVSVGKMLTGKDVEEEDDLGLARAWMTLMPTPGPSKVPHGGRGGGIMRSHRKLCI